MKPRQYVHGLLILSYAIIFCCCLIMIIKYDRKSGWDQKIWMGSKILTVKNEIKKNNYELYPILNFNSDSTYNKYNHNYESLLKNSGKECEENYKKCGILDTYGNIMCIPEGDECPINEMIVDSFSKKDEYLSIGYQYIQLQNLSEDYFLYYTNQKTDNEIIVKFNFSKEVPRYVNEKNFILDSDTFVSYLLESEEEDEPSGVGVFGDLEEGYKDDEILKYVIQKSKEDINIDKSYKKIFDNLYVGNYIGFKDYTNMHNFNYMNLYESYFTVFPNKAADVFCYFSLVVNFFLAFFSLCIICDGLTLNDYCCVCAIKIILISIYMTFFIGYFIYCLYEYFNIYKNRNPEDLLNIRADFFIENLLNDIYNRHPDKNYIFSIIILLSCSAFINIIAWIISIFYTKNIYGTFKKCGNLNTINDLI